MSGGPPGGSEVVRSPSRRSRRCREALPEVPKLSGGPPEGLRVVGRPAQRSGSGQESLLDVRVWSGGPPDVQSGREALPEVRE